ncbi:Olfactory receptor 1F12 [Labeo rohita]|uniref:Olfactory receptor 1F12 n=1 Tax=Labeo rohita TaxID=84645 RepID=A0A498NUI9_LABRO|nr:Olfactory receptor 1F12 [Labeo rohita]
MPRAKQAARQLLPVFPELLEELAVTWKDKPFTSKVPVQGGSALDVEGMEKEGLIRMPPMEQLVAAHLHPRHPAAANPSLPSKADRVQSNMMERAYKAVALCVRALNATSLLTAYQAELQDEASTTPGQTHWEEICVVTDLFFT